MSTARSSGLVLIFIIVFGVAGTSHSFRLGILNFPFVKFYVRIVNGLSDGNYTLSFHCKSKDNDLGMRRLAAGSEFSWGFRQNLFASTLYWCHMRKDIDKAHAKFAVFWPERKHAWLSHRCILAYCKWIAHDDGIYLYNVADGFAEFIHNWEPAGMLNTTDEDHRS
ncbi:hypothetical protein SLA2020_347920 [Shorea laevis]